MTGALQLGSNKITGLAAATNPADAVTKAQLDSGISTATTAQTQAAASATAAAASQTAAAASATAAAASQTAAAASAATAANLTRSTVFIGFQRQTDGDLRMYWNNSSLRALLQWPISSTRVKPSGSLAGMTCLLRQAIMHLSSPSIGGAPSSTFLDLWLSSI